MGGAAGKTIPVGALLSALAAAVVCSVHAATVVTVTNVVRAQEFRRIGLGMSGYNSDSPFLKNIVPAPGFEPGHYASVVIATNGSTGTKFIQKYIICFSVSKCSFFMTK